MANLQLVAGGDVGALEHEVAAPGHRRRPAQPGGRPAAGGRVAARRRSAPSWPRWPATPAADQRAAIAEAGLIMPHWPAPWGRGASPLEQLVIDEEMAAAGVPRPHLAVGAWALPTLIAHGTAEQQERWVRPTLLGELNWCQLFSEPGRGVRPGRAEHEGRAGRGRLGAERAEGVDVAGPDGRLRHLPGPLGPRRGQARRHHLLHRRHARRGPRHPAAPRADRRRHVQRGLLQRRLRARRRRRGRAGGRLAHRAHDAGQRAGLHVVGRVLRPRRRVADPDPGPPERARRARPAPAWRSGSGI